MLVRAAGTGSSPHTALINDSTDTGRLRLIRSMANTARCFGGPTGTRTPWEVISKGPKTPKPRPVFVIALPASRVIGAVFEGLKSPFLTHTPRRQCIWWVGRGKSRAGSASSARRWRRFRERVTHPARRPVEHAHQPLDGALARIRISVWASVGSSPSRFGWVRSRKSPPLGGQRAICTPMPWVFKPKVVTNFRRRAAVGPRAALRPHRTKRRPLPSSLVPHDRNQRSQRIPRLIAVVAGLVGVLLCVLVPLLPVKQTTATVVWPQGTTDGQVTQITAPLVSGAPRALDISIPCVAMATLPPGGGLVVSTLPAGGVDAGKNGLFVRADKDTIVVAFRDSVAAVAQRSAVAAGACTVLHAWANAGAAGADFVGIPGAAGTLPSEKKPQVGGIFTDLKVPAQPGLSARVDIDTRFITAPTIIKKVVMVVGGLAVLVAILALAALDRRSRGDDTLINWRSPIGWLSRYRPRAHWATWWRVGAATWLADVGVIATLLLWHVIGATSSDDGYNLTIARVAPKAGYVANYYRYFGRRKRRSTGISRCSPNWRRSARPAYGCGYPP